MEYYINYAGEEIKFKNINEFSFAEYNLLVEILQNIDEDSYTHLLNLYTGRELNFLSNKNLMKIDWVNILKDKVAHELISEWREYKLIDLNKITIGRFIDIEYFLTNEDYSMEYVIGMMLLPTEYSMEKLTDIVAEIQKIMKITNGVFIYEMFKNFRNDIYKQYSALFDIIEEAEDEEESKLDNDDEQKDDEQKDNDPGLGLMEYVYHLSSDNILNVDKILDMTLIEVFNYLAYQKTQADKLKERTKNI